MFNSKKTEGPYPVTGKTCQKKYLLQLLGFIKKQN